jgi:hypothetical protein
MYAAIKSHTRLMGSPLAMICIFLSRLSRHGLWMRSIPLLAIALTGREASAQPNGNYFWSNSAGGSYSAVGNWLSLGVPDASNEAAFFNLSASYAVSVPVSVSVASLSVPRGDVEFDFAVSNPTLTYQTSSMSIEPAAGSVGGITF